MNRLLLTTLALAASISTSEVHAVMAEYSCMNMIAHKASFDKLMNPATGLSALERDFDTIPRDRRFRIMRAIMDEATKDLAWFARVFRWSEFEPALARANSIMAYYDAGQANEASMLAALETLKSRLGEALRRAKVTECEGAGPLLPMCQPFVVRPAPAPREIPHTGLIFESDVTR